MEERRQFIRINKSLIVRYQVLKDFLQASSSESKDISEGGIRLPVAKRFIPGIILKLWIRLEEISEPIIAVGEVLWLKDISGSGLPYEVGIKFIKIDSGDRSRLYNYVSKLSEENSPK